jgi:hypothetical protein
MSAIAATAQHADDTDGSLSAPAASFAPLRLACPPLVLATELGGATGGLATTAAVAVEASGWGPRQPGGVLVAEIGGARARPPTMLASEAARAFEDSVRAADIGAVAARGRLCWLCLDADGGAVARLDSALDAAAGARLAVAFLPSSAWADAIERLASPPVAGLLRADPGSERPLLALAVRELHERGLRARVATRPLGRVGARRALAGLAPGGAASRRIARLTGGLVAGAGSDTVPAQWYSLSATDAEPASHERSEESDRDAG